MVRIRTTGRMVAAFDFLPRQLSFAAYVVVLLLVGLGSLLWWRTRCWPALAVLALPIPVRLWLVILQLAAWRFVILGFVLLFGGAAVSWWKGKKLAPAASVSPPETSSTNVSSPPG